jgi:hypothetical protein
MDETDYANIVTYLTQKKYPQSFENLSAEDKKAKKRALRKTSQIYELKDNGSCLYYQNKKVSTLLLYYNQLIHLKHDKYFLLLLRWF